MASGCIPAHASYFLAYEHLKQYFEITNDEFDLKGSLTVGFCTTFAHDFFITPADGKFKSTTLSLFKAKTLNLVIFIYLSTEIK